MKKLIYFIMLLTLLICTTGCVTLHDKFERVDDIDNIVGVLHIKDAFVIAGAPPEAQQ